MSGIDLRSNRFASFQFINSGTDATYSAGQMTVVEDTVGVMVESVGTSGATKSDDYPNAAVGAFVYEAEKIVVPKTTADSFAAGDVVYFNTSEAKITSSSTGNLLCGVALQAASTSATTISIALDGKSRS
jgi:predicted RecA/RadA family phage recombinase